MKQSSKSIQEQLEELAPKASRVAFASYLEWTETKVNEDIAAALVAAIGILPSSGPIRKKKYKQIVKALTWLLDEIPTDDPRRPDIESWLGEALTRTR